MEQKEQMEQHLTGSVSAPVGFMMMALSSSITGCACAHAAIESDRFTHRIEQTYQFLLPHPLLLYRAINALRLSPCAAHDTHADDSDALIFYPVTELEDQKRAAREPKMLRVKAMRKDFEDFIGSVVSALRMFWKQERYTAREITHTMSSHPT